MSVALPAYFAGQGYGKSEIAGYLAIITLPWGYKFLAGPLMDRFSAPELGAPKALDHRRARRTHDRVHPCRAGLATSRLADDVRLDRLRTQLLRDYTGRRR